MLTWVISLELAPRLVFHSCIKFLKKALSVLSNMYSLWLGFYSICIYVACSKLSCSQSRQFTRRFSRSSSPLIVFCSFAVTINPFLGPAHKLNQNIYTVYSIYHIHYILDRTAQKLRNISDWQIQGNYGDGQKSTDIGHLNGKTHCAQRSSSLKSSDQTEEHL